jgi:hypothetical protein
MSEGKEAVSLICIENDDQIKGVDKPLVISITLLRSGNSVSSSTVTAHTLGGP